ncbi:MAG: cyclic nucleotide-binding domain-containing protein [Candidatus Riflebacteria bacterium]|nr:cyclic nucleotide-binding domain-containing protein [Candidatus Riflebacteria bacterium]MBR4570425.1 cyclic nucleotide-binding domain-containing protein [Candidatus Riflebacteria bacterium]
MQITVDLIKSLQLFSKLSKEDIAASLNIFKLVEPDEPNYVIFEEGDPGDSLFMIIKGQVEIIKHIDAEAGTNKILAVLPTGSFFGEMALLTGESRSASAVMRGADGKLIKIERNDFMSFMASTPKVASQLLGCLVRSLSDRLRDTSTDVVTLYETGRIIGQTNNPNEIITQVLARMMKVTNATAGFVMMWNEVVECFECIVGLPEKPPVTSLSAFSALSRYWQNLDIPVTSTIADNFVDTRELGFNLPSVMYTPLIVNQQNSSFNNNQMKNVVGIAVLVSPVPNAFSLQHLNLSKSVADQVSQAIVNSRLLMEKEARRQHEQVYVTADL